jgi:hypothetical protein
MKKRNIDDLMKNLIWFDPNKRPTLTHDDVIKAIDDNIDIFSNID